MLSMIPSYLSRQAVDDFWHSPQIIVRYLQETWRDQKEQAVPEWLCSLSETEVTVPQQDNATDCGLYILIFM